MKKRSISLLLCLVMIFSLLPFSAMAEVYIFEGDAIQLDFYRNSGDAKPFNTQRVLANGIDAIYDPGCTLGENEYFVGWQITGVEGVKATIDDVRAYVEANKTALAGSTDPLVITAVVSPVHYVVYYDENNRVVKTAAVVKALNGDSWNTTVNYDYIPVNVNSEFDGWKDVNNNTYQNGDTIAAGSDTDANDVELRPIVKTGYWVTFDENDRPVDPDTGKGNPDLTVNIHADYQPPVFGEQDQEVNLDAYTVSAPKWHFDGWFTAPTGGTQVHKASGETTVYAHWTAQTADYKIAYWQQNANDDGYSLKEVVPAQGTAGTVATFDQNKTYENFHRNDTLTNAQKELVTIEGDGTTIRNVYFDRDEFTLKFYRQSKSGETGTLDVVNVSNSNAATFYLYVVDADGKVTGETKTFKNGAYQLSDFENLAYRSGDTYYYAVSNNTLYYNYNYYGYRYSGQATANKYVLEKEITAKYQQDIGENFPIINDGKGATWNPPADCESFQWILVYIGTMPAENITFCQQSAGTNNPLKMEFYVEPDPGQSGTYTYDQKPFVKYGNTVPAAYSFFTKAEDYPNLTGYSKYAAYPEFNSDGIAYVDDYNNTLKLYYMRQESTLYFVPGDGSDWNETVKYKDPLAPHEPLSGDHQFIKGETTKMVNGKKMIFQGWYDNKDYAGEAFDFSKTMPALDSITLYAKWEEAKYRVELNLNGGTISSGTFFKVDYNGTASLSNPTRTDYDFAGWYTDEACTQRFNENTRLIDTTVTDLNWTEENEPTVRGKLTLYAKWRHVMDAETYLTVAYDANGGTGAPDDDLHYADQAEAIAQPASVPGEDGESFAYWEILKPKSATDPTLVPSGVTVKPGEIFNVKMDDALNNTVTLRAHYEASKGTHIVWYGNGGTTAEGATEVSSADANLNAAIQVKPADTFTREGYEFLGWARLSESAMKNPDGTWKPYTGNELWLKWDGAHYTAVKDNGQTVTDPDIAANEDGTLHVLYAVWDKADNHNYVIDFNGKMTLATGATEKKGDTHNNGVFEIANDGKATYQLKNNEDTFANGADLTFNGIDTALINGVPVGSAEGTTASWEKYTVIPANNVYFDDDLVGKSMTAGDGSGYNAEVSKYTGAADGQSKTTIEIKFTGTGIDVYCTTPDANGWIQATVDGTNKQPYTNTKYQGGGELHNIPVISFRDLGTGTHTLVITTLTGANFKLDGIRVYNPMQDATGDTAEKVDAAYEAANEQNAVFMEVRDYLLTKDAFETVNEDGAQTTKTGAVFIDTNEANTSVTTYEKAGPKNEVYLDKGQGVAFTISGWSNYKDTNKVMVGLSVPAGSTATVAASGRTGDKKISLNAETHMYYDITPDPNGNVYIYNVGDSMVSVTDLKITGPTEYTVSKGFTLGAPVDVENEGGVLAVDTVMLMKYVQDFDPEAVIADPNATEPADDEKPAWDDNAFDFASILKDLFKMLLQSLSDLFAGLGNW